MNFIKKYERIFVVITALLSFASFVYKEDVSQSARESKVAIESATATTSILRSSEVLNESLFNTDETLDLQFVRLNGLLKPDAKTDFARQAYIGYFYTYWLGRCSLLLLRLKDDKEFLQRLPEASGEVVQTRAKIDELGSTIVANEDDQREEYVKLRKASGGTGGFQIPPEVEESTFYPKAAAKLDESSFASFVQAADSTVKTLHSAALAEAERQLRQEKGRIALAQWITYALTFLTAVFAVLGKFANPSEG